MDISKASSLILILLFTAIATALGRMGKWALVFAKLWCDVFIYRRKIGMECILRFGKNGFYWSLLFAKRELWLFAKRKLWCDVFIELLYLRNCDAMFLYREGRFGGEVLHTWHGMYFALWEEWFLLSSSICETRTVTICETRTVMWCFYWALVFAKLWCDVFISHVAWNVFCALGRTVFIELFYLRNANRDYLRNANCNVMFLLSSCICETVMRCFCIEKEGLAEKSCTCGMECILRFGKNGFYWALLFAKRVLWLLAKRELWCDVFIELLYLRNCDVIFIELL